MCLDLLSFQGYCNPSCFSFALCSFTLEFVSKLLLSASGMVVPSKTKIVCHFSTLVLTCGQQHTLHIAPRDEYDNPTSNSVSLVDEHNYSLSIHEVGATSSLLLVFR